MINKTFSRLVIILTFLVLSNLHAQNNSPVLEPLGDFKVKEGYLLSISLNGFDIDEDSLTFSATNLPPGAEFHDSIGVLFWEPDYDQYGAYSNIHFEVTDGQGGIDSEDVTVNVVHWPPGDVNGSGTNTLGDIIFLINHIFNKPGNWVPNPLSAGDFNLDGSVTLADVIYDVNFIFRGGPPPEAKPELMIVYPPKGTVLNATHWLHVENLTGLNFPGKTDLYYSSDSLNYTLLSYDTVTNPFYIFDTTNITGLWQTDSLPSGEYHLKAVYSDSSAVLAASAGETADEVKIRINRAPRPQIDFFYDQIGNQAIFLCQNPGDPEGDTILDFYWRFSCDSSEYHAPQVFKQFFQPETCLVVLEVRDQFHNVGVEQGTLFYTPPVVTFDDDSVYNCECESLAIITTGSIPTKKGAKESDPGNSSLKYPSAKAHPDGNKKLGPLDHTTPLANGKNTNLHIALYFMVEAKVNGDATQCSTLQMVNGTIKFDGATVGTPTKKDYVRPEDKPAIPYPFKPSPSKSELGVKVVYTTPCGGTPKNKDMIEKKDGVIRWICTPGIHVLEEQAGNENISASKNFDNLFKNNGVEFEMFFWVEVIDNKQEIGCVTGDCKKCFIFKFKYDKDKGRQDVDGDNQPDPPKIVQFVPCPTM
jgi:hypothetical protein